MHTKHKATTGAPNLKAASDGTVRVAFAQLNVIDHDRDITMPGAFQTGQKVKMCQTGHAHGALPCGAGEIVGEEVIDGATWAVAELKFFLDTPQGDATYKTVKALAESGQTQEWSYGYDILDAEQATIDGQYAQALKSLSVYEISPVLRGAGIGTHTIDVKSKDDACVTCGQSTKGVALVQNFTSEPDVEAAAKAAQQSLDASAAVEADADRVAKGRAVEALAQFELTRAKTLGVQIE